MHWRIGCWQNRKHEESHTVSRSCCKRHAEEGEFYRCTRLYVHPSLKGQHSSASNGTISVSSAYENVLTFSNLSENSRTSSCRQTPSLKPSATARQSRTITLHVLWVRQSIWWSTFLHLGQVYPYQLRSIRIYCRGQHRVLPAGKVTLLSSSKRRAFFPPVLSASERHISSRKTDLLARRHRQLFLLEQ